MIGWLAWCQMSFLPMTSYRSELGYMPHPTPSSVIDKGLPRLFSLTVIQPMEPQKKKKPTSPGHTANYLNSWTKFKSANKKRRGKWLLYRQPTVSPTRYLLRWCSTSPGFSRIADAPMPTWKYTIYFYFRNQWGEKHPSYGNCTVF